MKIYAPFQKGKGTAISYQGLSLLLKVQSDTSGRSLRPISMKRDVLCKAVPAIRYKIYVKVISLPCIGMIQPDMIETGFNAGADGIFICGCVMGDG